MPETRMPLVYKLPLGLPFYWRDEVSGELPAAVNAYLDCRIDQKPFTLAQAELVRDYLIHWINAPCWEHPEFAQDLAKLREKVKTLNTADEIGAWIWEALEIGLDPL